MVIIVMGVAGSGKSTVGRLLAARLGWPFRDADDFHPPGNRAKMRRGIPLDDDDRRPWLEAIRTSISEAIGNQANAVYACSALKRAYRKILATDTDDVEFVYLKGSQQVIARRLTNRKGHFFDPALLQTQFDDLEEPCNALVVDIAPPPEAVVDSIIADLGLRQALSSNRPDATVRQRIN
jgi:gluconokinase